MLRRISSASPWEREIGYARAVVAGGFIHVSGTNGFHYETMTISPDPAAQAAQALRNIAFALKEADATLSDVVRVRYILPEPADFPPCWPVLRAAFGAAPPAATMFVAALIDPRIKIEIEATALLP